jgi:polysaccharide export outer membrane protein
VIEVGDLVNVTLWDNEESSLLTSPGQKVVQLPNLTVSSSGTIFLPYADEVYIAKMSAEDARKAVQDKLLPMIPSLQVQLNYVSGRKSSVDLVSGVSSPGNYPLEDRNMTLLSVLALGGGVPSSTVNPQVRLSRGGKLYGISMDRLLADPSLDPALRGGDKIYVEPEQRYFLSFGAAGREAQITFPQDSLSAMEAVTLSGGLSEARADAKGILILRDYAASAVRSDGTGPEKERMIFAFDLTTADGLFSAGEFPIQHKDLVLATESPLSNTRTILSLFGSALGLANAADNF